MQENTQTIFLMHPSTVGDRCQVSVCMTRDSEVTKLLKVAERINESTANPVIDSVGRWQVSIFVDCQTEVG